jgi:hypothetical protein
MVYFAMTFIVGLRGLQFHFNSWLFLIFSEYYFIMKDYFIFGMGCTVAIRDEILLVNKSSLH